MDLLITLHRRLQPVVDRVGIRRVAQQVFRSLMKFRYGNDGLAEAVQNGRVWLLHPEVALRGERAEYETIEWLRTVVKPGMTVVDVGANIGQMTLEMAFLVGQSGRVVAIEPASGNLTLLNLHLEANKFYDRVTVVAAACSDKAGEQIALQIFGQTSDSVGSGHSITMNVAPPSGPAGVTVSVPTTSIDALCAGMRLAPSVLKIDVEGAELLVLKGALKTLFQHKPAIRFGFHPFAFTDPAATSDEIRNLLARSGYQIASDEPEMAFDLKEYVATAAKIA